MSVASDPLVAVVVTTYNYAHYLKVALDSIVQQTHAADEIIVVDDGSHDSPEVIVSQYPGIKFIRTENQGLSAARNTGARAATARFIVFLDADDALLPNALADGLACMAANPDAGFVYGACRFVDERLRPLGGPRFKRISSLAHHDFLKDNVVGMPATALTNREHLLAVGGFDPTMLRCEDYEFYLRMSKKFRVASHPNIVVDYRQHGANMSKDAIDMHDWTMRAHQLHRPDADDTAALASWKIGRNNWNKAYANRVWFHRPGIDRTEKWGQRIGMIRKKPMHAPAAMIRSAIIRALPVSLANYLRRLSRPKNAPRPGQVDLGDLNRIKPISETFGFDRGKPIDRYYIESFLERHRADIVGRTLEFGDYDYCGKYGSNLTGQVVMDIIEATSQGQSMASLAAVEESSFDCLVMPQALSLVYDMAEVLTRLKRVLRPGGVVLASVPGISSVDMEIEENWYWLLTRQSATRLFSDVFGPDNVEVEIAGNAFAATCFLQGLALEDVGRSWLQPRDPKFPVIITIRATK